MDNLSINWFAGFLPSTVCLVTILHFRAMFIEVIALKTHLGFSWDLGYLGFWDGCNWSTIWYFLGKSSKIYQDSVSKLDILHFYWYFLYLFTHGRHGKQCKIAVHFLDLILPCRDVQHIVPPRTFKLWPFQATKILWHSILSHRYPLNLATPWKINMEHTNHPFRKENDLPNLYDDVPC